MFQVTPSEKGTAEKSEETAWTEEDEETVDFNRKGLSKSKRVKSYIQKKCKDVEVKVRSRSKSGSRGASWYVCTEDSRTEGGTPEPLRNPPGYPVQPSTSETKNETPSEAKMPVEEAKIEAETTGPEHQLPEDNQKPQEEDNSDTASEGTLLDETQHDEITPQPQVLINFIFIIL